MLLIIIVAVLVGLISAAYCWARYQSNYWQRTNVPFIPAAPFVGNLWPVIANQCSIVELFERMYSDPRVRDAPLFGVHFFHQPVIFLRDPDFIRQLLVADFGAFSDRFSYSDVHDPLGNQNVLLARNPLWHRLRKRLAPFFSTGRLRRMFSLMDAVGADLNAQLLRRRRIPVKSAAAAVEAGGEIEVKELAGCYSTDVIASCAFGLQANSLSDKDSEFRANGRAAFEFNLYRAVEVFVLFFLPQMTRVLGFRQFNAKFSAFLRSSIEFVIGERERSGAVRHDLIDTLIELKRADRDRVLEDKDDVRFAGDVLVAQAGIFYTAGFEPSSGAISFALYELARHPDVQTRARNEIRAMLEQNGDQLTYESVQELAYLQCVISEVLRLYPLLPLLDRRCTLEPGRKAYSLRTHGIDFEIPNGMGVIVPVTSVQHDARNYADPMRFDPERFAPENRKDLVPYTFLPFGVGPRNCFGERFGWLQTKIGLVNVLRNHAVRPSERTPEPLRYERNSVFLQAEKGIYLHFVRDPLIGK